MGEYQFDPTEDGVITPYLYGLAAVPMKPLAALATEEKQQATSEVETETGKTPVIENKNRTLTIKIRHEWIANAVSVAAAVMLFFFLSTPVDNTYIEEENYASLGNISVFEQVKKESLLTTLMPTSAPAKKVMTSKAKPAPAPKASEATTEKPIEKPVATTVAKSEPAPKAEPAPVKETPKATTVKAVAKPAPVATKPSKPSVQPAPQKQATTTYNIIVASVTAEGDAQTAIDGFAAKGFPGAFLIKGGGRFRIALKAYQTEADAYAKVNELKQNALFKDAWVLKTKK